MHSKLAEIKSRLFGLNRLFGLRRLAGGKQHSLRLAVVGAPSSGKTSFLCDVVRALDAFGYVHEAVPLTAHYSSIGQFFYDAGSDGGGVSQTSVYACRRENHYGGVFTGKGGNGRLEIDFLNIPGEVFAGNNKRMDMFFDLKDCIGKIDKSKLVVTRFVNPAGREQLVVEPSAEVRALLHLDNSVEASANEASINYRRMNYLRWEFILAELKNECYERKESKSVTGRYVLDHFFDLNTDSVIQTLTDIWETFAKELDYFDYEANDVLRFAYFMLYCSHATHIILCDKLFVMNSMATTEGYDFESLTKQLCNLIEHSDRKAPRVCLAFRGADIIIKEKAEHYCGLIKKEMTYDERRKVVYDAFMKDMNDIMRRGAGGDDDCVGWGSAVTPTGMPLVQHVLTRTGSSLGYGFWHLLNKLQPTGVMAKLQRMVTGEASISHIYSDTNRPMIPPHVFFTATPIDIDMNIYDNDKDDVTVFTTTTDDAIKSFDIETACHGTQSMCFGTYQLLAELLGTKL